MQRVVAEVLRELLRRELILAPSQIARRVVGVGQILDRLLTQPEGWRSTRAVASRWSSGP